MTRDLGVCTTLDALRQSAGDPAGRSVIDIGSGDGSFARALAGLGAEVTGFDPLGAEQPWTVEGAGRYRLVRDGADALPFPDGSVDLVAFIYSLHHIPAAALPGILAQARRVLRPDGCLFIAEPLAEGPHQEVSGLFHDETAVRQHAADILATAAPALFSRHDRLVYRNRRQYAGFEEYAERMAASMRFNDFSEAQLRAPAVRERFEAVSAPLGGIFDQPVRIDFLRP